MNKSWQHYCVYALSLAISLALNLYRPDVLGVLCTPLPIRDSIRADPSIDGYLNSDSIPPTHEVK